MLAEKTIIGNWKMNGTPQLARSITAAVAAYSIQVPPEVKIVLCPPAIWLEDVNAALSGTQVATGGQDCSPESEGAFTGDISAAMLRDAGCEYVIVGHSERRTLHRETSDTVRRKAQVAIKAGLAPVICIGETEAERTAGKAQDVVAEQIRDSLPPEAAKNHFLLAYEPVWAIGSGKTPTPEDIRVMHAHIMRVTAIHIGLADDSVGVLYGGSVKAANAAEILAVPGVAGALVGGASLKAEEFCAIIAAAIGKG
jgi:triosephosphate isomerase